MTLITRHNDTSHYYSISRVARDEMSHFTPRYPISIIRSGLSVRNVISITTFLDLDDKLFQLCVAHRVAVRVIYCAQGPDFAKNMGLNLIILSILLILSHYNVYR